MAFDWSEITISREYGEYGIAFNSKSLHLITLTMEGGSSFVIGNFIKPENFPLSYFERVVSSLEQKSRAFAADQTYERFMAEAEAYVRARVRANPDYIDEADDPEWWETAVDDIRTGLRLSLRERDAYRAARQFDACVRCLDADFGIIDLMQPILATFHADTDASLGSWVEQAAAAEQRMVRGRSPFISAAIDRLHESSGRLVMGRH